MIRRSAHIVICAILVAAVIGSASLLFAQTYSGSWTVTPPFPKMFADSPDGWRVFVSIAKPSISSTGITLWPDSKVAIDVVRSTSSTPPYLPAGDYKLTLKIRNTFSSNIIRMYKTDAGAMISNLSGKLVAQCYLPPGSPTRPVDTQCMGTYKLAQSETVHAYFTVDHVSDFISATFTKPF